MRAHLPGQRIIRSVLSVWLCFVIYLLRGRQGIPFYSAIAALQCLQPYTGSISTVAKNRIGGTLIGAFWGLMIILLESAFPVSGIQGELLHYLALGLFTGMVLYFTVLVGASQMAYFSSVVFLCIAVNHIGDENPYIFVLNRVLDTFLGVVIAELINRLHFPRQRHPEILFVSGMNDTIFGLGKRLSPYAKVELNRLIQDGAQFTISTIQHPVIVRELLDGVNIRLPIIAMNGAALYDTLTNEYLKVVYMSEPDAKWMTEYLDSAGLCYVTNSIEENLHMVHCGKLGNGALYENFETMRHSLSRHFMEHRKKGVRNMIYFMVLDETGKIDALYQELQQLKWKDHYRTIYDESKRTEKEACIKIYAADASRENMLKELETLLSPERVVTFGHTAGQYDVVIKNADKDCMIREMKRIFEPVDLHCWRSIFRP